MAAFWKGIHMPRKWNAFTTQAPALGLWRIDEVATDTTIQGSDPYSAVSWLCDLG